MTPSDPVVIVGAGLSGLCLAQRLLRAGIEVRVYERDPAPFARRQGYRITVDKHGLAALRASLPPELFQEALATAGSGGGYFRFTNSQLRDAIKLSFKATPDAERQMDRQTLRRILLSDLGDRVHYGKAATTVEPGGTPPDDTSAAAAAVVSGGASPGDASVAAVEPGGAHPGQAGLTSRLVDGAAVGASGAAHSGRAASAGGLTLRFADGTAVGASVIVGADGIGSAVRAQLMPDAEPGESGIAGIYGRTPFLRDGRSVIPEALHKSGVLALGDKPGRAFFFTTMHFGRPSARFAPAAEDYVMWGLVIAQDEAPSGLRADPAQLRSLAARLARGFHPLVGRLVDAATEEDTVLSHFAVGRRPVRWPFARATMMGDAVHAMPPFGAHGGNTALRDAALLGGKLAEAYAAGGSIESAIAAYQAEMPTYAFQAVDRAASMMRRCTSSGPVARWVISRLLPGLHRPTVPAA